jgi:hypothetical protein
MEYELWIGGNSHFERDPARVENDQDPYGHLMWVEDGPTYVHAVRPGDTGPVCGAVLQVLIKTGEFWHESWPRNRCPRCLEQCPCDQDP